jgi:hypothetical protein
LTLETHFIKLYYFIDKYLKHRNLLKSAKREARRAQSAEPFYRKQINITEERRAKREERRAQREERREKSPERREKSEERRAKSEERRAKRFRKQIKIYN